VRRLLTTIFPPNDLLPTNQPYSLKDNRIEILPSNLLCGSLLLIDADSNQIRDIKNFCIALQFNKKLVKLGLQSNRIVKVDTLAIALKTNSTLEDVYLFRNPIRAPKSMWQDVSSLRSNPVVQVFELLQGLREMRRDHRAYSVATSFRTICHHPQKDHGGFFRLWECQGAISQFLWHSDEISAALETRVLSLFGLQISEASEKASAVLKWLLEEKKSLEEEGPQRSRRKRKHVEGD